jgi:hypothetical protein
MGEDHGYGSIHNCDRRGLEPLDVRTDLQTKLSGHVGRILVVKKMQWYLVSLINCFFINQLG